MRCPFCAHEDTQVVETRESDEGDVVRRRRRCLHCEKRFTTYERSDIQKLIDNATDAYTVLMRDPIGTPELQEIGILELLQRYPCRGSEAR